MNDPHSAPALFRDWRAHFRIEYVASYIEALRRADAFYSAENEPTDAINAWTDGMGNLSKAINRWIDTAVDWQISSASDADLKVAAAVVMDAMRKAKRTSRPWSRRASVRAPLGETSAAREGGRLAGGLHFPGEPNHDGGERRPRPVMITGGPAI